MISSRGSSSGILIQVRHSFILQDFVLAFYIVDSISSFTAVEMQVYLVFIWVNKLAVSSAAEVPIENEMTTAVAGHWH